LPCGDAGQPFFLVDAAPPPPIGRIGFPRPVGSETMLYAAATMWLMLIVLLAWGVHHLWSGLIKPKVVNSILLPGTLVAQIGHVFGLLVTGGTVNNTALMTDDESGAPQTATDAKPRVPVVGPIIVALLPMVALGIAIYQSVRWVGMPMMHFMPTE